MMKKTTFLYIFIFAAYHNLALGMEQDSSSIRIQDAKNTTESIVVPWGKKTLSVNLNRVTHSLTSIVLPLTVDSVQINHHNCANSHIYLYAEHTPQINYFNSYNRNSSLKIMHPIRQYTYHIASLLICGLTAFYLCLQSE